MKYTTSFLYGFAAVLTLIAKFIELDRRPFTQKIDSKLREEKSAKIDSKVWESQESARFRRLMTAGDPDASHAFERDAAQTAYERKAAIERIQRANLGRSPRSRACEPRLVEEWVPFGEVSL